MDIETVPKQTGSNILVTGAAGFIGFHVSKRLSEEGHHVLGIDNLNSYYDVELKHARLEQLARQKHFSFEQCDLNDPAFASVFKRFSPGVVIHLAAQAGVRYSLEAPEAYAQSNLSGFLQVLEACRLNPVSHLVYASTSSVYGANTKKPYCETQSADHPLSLYAATKKANEAMAHAYSHLFRIPATGLRFFTVYGPWGRPDMALFLFTSAILEGRPIDVFNHGQMKRDFTYIDDVVDGIARVLDLPPQGNSAWDGDRPDPATSAAPHQIFNIGNSAPVPLTEMIEVLESCLGKTAKRNLLPMQPGDVPETFADVSALSSYCGYQPSTSIEDGISKFVAWYRGYYRV